MTLIGLDLNSSRIRAVHGASHGAARPLPLEDQRPELALALALDGREPVVGRAGLRLCRTEPHEACLDFLPHLGSSQKWIGDRHTLDAAEALSLTFEKLRRSSGRADAALTLALPTYLRSDQLTLISKLALEAGLRLHGLVAAPLAAVLAARPMLPWTGRVLVLDADGHALTWSLVELAHDQARVTATAPIARLGSAAWMARLLDQITQRCIQTTRRDLRESGEAEQGLYDQVRYFLEGGFPEGRIDFSLQMGQWSQLLTFPTRELHGFCATLALRSLQELRSLLQPSRAEPIVAVLVTQDASRLPGLLTALEPELRPLVNSPSAPAGEFDIDLIAEGLEASPVQILPADALAWAARELALQVQRGELGQGVFETLPLTRKAPAAPARRQPTRF